MSIEIKKNIISEASEEGIQETKTKKIEIESSSTIDVKKLEVTFKTKEEELKKWQNELENKANELEMKAIEIDQKSLELDERQKNAEEALKQKINLEYNEAKFKLSDEQANIRA